MISKTEGNTDLSPAMIFFLGTFQVPRTKDDLPVLSYGEWCLCLGKDPIDVTRYFLRAGYLQRSSLYHHINIKFTTAELRELLGDRHLSTTGNKNELIRRLLENDYNHMQELLRDFEVLECSARGREIVESYLATVSGGDAIALPNAVTIGHDKLRALLSFLAGSAVGGVIGNRVDALIVSLIEHLSTKIPSKPHVFQQTVSGLDSNVANVLRKLSREHIVFLLNHYNNDPSVRHSCCLGSIWKDRSMVSLPNKRELEIISKLVSEGLLRLSGDMSVEQYIKRVSAIVAPYEFPRDTGGFPNNYPLKRRLTAEEETTLCNISFELRWSPS